ncbi:uncharacterized protein EDB91DRAFT_1138940 [Suillus paluster]|uniref:uncharacterized protein n=1 Tax=Suillus paluster TaxID=48578 RepID=UPI001B87BB23|nr:uncharacterized protein EDB91DRAFT_1138940 [Suillus paluster]KAG1738446.1 hypothetical protein EDB91DRAFT_1138940 [Suillus paluster]
MARLKVFLRSVLQCNALTVSWCFMLTLTQISKVLIDFFFGHDTAFSSGATNDLVNWSNAMPHSVVQRWGIADSIAIRIFSRTTWSNLAVIRIA